MTAEAEKLLNETKKLDQEHRWMQEHIAQLESEASQKDVAVNAMSSAVAGLEGWITHSPGASPRPKERRGRYIVRGRGRFRGKIFVEDPEGDVVRQEVQDTFDARELEDGVKAWVRGFRDVEEELHRTSPQSSPRKPKVTRIIRNDAPSTDDLPSSDEDDWGDFETVSATQDMR